MGSPVSSEVRGREDGRRVAAEGEELVAAAVGDLFGRDEQILVGDAVVEFKDGVLAAVDDREAGARFPLHGCARVEVIGGRGRRGEQSRHECEQTASGHRRAVRWDCGYVQSQWLVATTR